MVDQGYMSLPHGPRSALQPLGPTVDQQLIKSVRQTGNKERDGNGGGYEGMGAVGHERVTSISPRATSSSARQTEEDKLRPLSLPLPFSVSQDPPTSERPTHTDVPG